MTNGIDIWLVALFIASADARKKAIRDGLLVDVSNTAEKVGIIFQTVLTKAAYEKYVRIPDSPPPPYDYERLPNILRTLRHAIAANDRAERFPVALTVRNDDGSTLPVKLKALWDLDDAGDLFITAMLPDEY